MSMQQLREAVDSGDMFFFDNTEIDLHTNDEDLEDVRAQFAHALPDRFFTDEVARQKKLIRERMSRQQRFGISHPP